MMILGEQEEYLALGTKEALCLSLTETKVCIIICRDLSWRLLHGSALIKLSMCVFFCSSEDSPPPAPTNPEKDFKDLLEVSEALDDHAGTPFQLLVSTFLLVCNFACNSRDFP